MKSESPKISRLMREVSSHIAHSVEKKLPVEVVERAKIHIVDTTAAMLSGSRLLPGQRAIAYVKAQQGKPEATVVGTRIVTSAPLAALANGMFGHADETDDTHPPSRTHPGTSVIPAALAIGERKRLPGVSVLRAIVLGYDLCARMLLAFDEQVFRYSGHHASSFGQVFGASAAAAALLGFDETKVRHTLSYTAEQAAGLYMMLRDKQHIEKAYAMGGMGAHNGTAAALMVAHGFTGVDDVFSGDRDFFYTFAPKADRNRLTRRLGQDYEILRGGIKRWPVGGPIQGPMHVLNDIIQTHRITVDDVQKIVARMPDKEFETVNNRDMPDICVQHLLAIMLLDGGATLRSTHDYARMKDPKVLALRKRVTVIPDPKLTDVLRRWRCVMEVTLKDGTVIKHKTLAAKGSFVNPLTRAEEQEKAMDLLEPIIGGRRAQRLMTALWNFDKIRDVRLLRPLLSA